MARTEKAEAYRIVGTEGEWQVAHNDETGMSYASKEAAFEAAVGAASNAIKAGRPVSIEIPGADQHESMLGSESPT
jgi:hypothetical protein